jgi:hypothetical protein
MQPDRPGWPESIRGAPSPAPSGLHPLPTTPPRVLCTEPGGTACLFFLAGRCCHALNETGACPLTCRPDPRLPGRPTA